MKMSSNHATDVTEDYRKMPKINILNTDGFAKMRCMNGYYVDKTGFIEKFLQSPVDKSKFRIPADATLFTRPRLFGKTMFLSMLAEFFDITKDSRKLFEGLAVSANRGLCAQWMNQYPVIFLSLRNVAGRNFAEALDMIRMRVSELCLEHSCLRKNPNLGDGEHKTLNALRANKSDNATLQDSLLFLTSVLRKHYGKPAIVLVDDYDAPLARAAAKGYYDKMVDFLHGFFSAALKTNRDNLKFGILTGRLHIPLQSGLNHLDIDDITTTRRYADVFGFTQDEVDKLLCDAGFSEKKEVFRDWYGGYRFGNKTEIYNPWNTMEYLSDLQASPTATPLYRFRNSSQNFFVKKVFPGEYLAMADKIANLVLGGVLVQWITRTSTYKNLDSAINLWAVLYQCGCLTRASEEQLQRLDVSPNPARDEMALVIPNWEIRKLFVRGVRDWFDDAVSKHQKSELLAAFWDANTERFKKGFHAILLKNVKSCEAKASSAYSAKALSENFYHGLWAAFFLVACPENLSFTAVNHRIYEIQVLDNRAGRAAIVEVRHTFDEREDLVGLAEQGLKQIEKNWYNVRLLSDSSVTTVLHWSIAFCKKSCEARAAIVRQQ